MVFSSTLFLLWFLPLALLGYALTPRVLHNLWLLAVSLLFYAWGEPQLVWVMLASIAVNYLMGLWIGQVRTTRWRMPVLALAVAVNLTGLAVFKYAGFLVHNLNSVLAALSGPQLDVPQLALPLGISFFTFHAMSYVIDVARGDAEPQKNPLDLALYVTLFPQLVAGPILRYHEVAWQLAGRRVGSHQVAYGIYRFVAGLGKKVLIANTLARPVDELLAVPASQLGIDTAWLAMVCYTGQIYFDFSGYSDMAVGLGHLFGFEFPENFQWPYSAVSVREFWRRWHISLSTWFRDYLYIPLGGSRGGELRTTANLLIVFVTCGLWHGASWVFLIWGLWHGAFLALERTRFAKWIARLPRPLQRGYVLLAAMLGWVWFRAPDLSFAVQWLGTLFGLRGGQAVMPATRYVTLDLLLAAVAAVVLATPRWQVLGKKLIENSQHWPTVPRRVLAVAAPIGAVLGLLTVLAGSLLMLAASTHNPFIYFRF